MNTLAKAVLDKLNEIGWKNADLAREAGLTTGALSNILNGHRVPEPLTILALARALKEPPIKYFRIMGWLPYDSDKTEDEEEVLYLYRQLPEIYRVFVLRMLRCNQGRALPLQAESTDNNRDTLDALDLMLKLNKVPPERIRNLIVFLEDKRDSVSD